MPTLTRTETDKLNDLSSVEVYSNRTHYSSLLKDLVEVSPYCVDIFPFVAKHSTRPQLRSLNIHLQLT